MNSKISKETIERTIDFHGHNCPGLTIGIRAAELALETLNFENNTDWVCVTETDMCGVDAIQFITGCTFGKGNLIHKDFGKSAFTFYDRAANKGFRALFLNTSAQQDQTREERIKELLNAPLNDLFNVQSIDLPPVRPARILKSIACSHCNELAMESRIRLFDGEKLCFPCFEKVEQKS